MIPPVKTESPSNRTGSNSPRSPYHSNATTYVPSRDGDLYNSVNSRSSYPPPENDNALQDKYSRSNGVGDVYSRGTGELDKDRQELFSGYNPQKAGSGRFFDGPQPGREPPPGEENDEDVEGIKQQTRFVKQESVNSTRNALRLAREAEDTARNTLLKLGDQSGTIFNASYLHLLTALQKNLQTLSVILTLLKATPPARTIIPLKSKSSIVPFSVPPLPSTKTPNGLLKRPKCRHDTTTNARKERRQ